MLFAIFQVPLFQLGDVTLFLSVYNRRRGSMGKKSKEMIGWLCLGLNSSGAEELQHWNDMRASRTPTQVQRWHSLLRPWNNNPSPLCENFRDEKSLHSILLQSQCWKEFVVWLIFSPSGSCEKFLSKIFMSALWLMSGFYNSYCLKTKKKYNNNTEVNTKLFKRLWGRKKILQRKKKKMSETQIEFRQIAKQKVVNIVSFLVGESFPDRERIFFVISVKILSSLKKKKKNFPLEWKIPEAFGFSFL